MHAGRAVTVATETPQRQPQAGQPGAAGHRHYPRTLSRLPGEPVPPGHKHSGVTAVIGVMPARELTATRALVVSHSHPPTATNTRAEPVNPARASSLRLLARRCPG